MKLKSLGAILGLILILYGVLPTFAESSEVLPPLRQLSNGVLPSEVVCKSGFQIIFKSSDGIPICIKSSSVKKLLQRGWLNYDSPIELLNDLRIIPVNPFVDKPNIVVIMTDDLDTATLNQMLLKGWMPNLQKFLIDNGTEFTNSFVTNSACCPSRSTFLTG